MAEDRSQRRSRVSLARRDRVGRGLRIASTGARTLAGSRSHVDDRPVDDGATNHIDTYHHGARTDIDIDIDYDCGPYPHDLIDIIDLVDDDRRCDIDDPCRASTRSRACRSHLDHRRRHREGEAPDRRDRTRASDRYQRSRGWRVLRTRSDGRTHGARKG